MFKLKILWYLIFLGKCFLKSLINSLPIFVFTLWLYGRLNHRTSLFPFLRAFWVLLLLKDVDEKCPLSFIAVSCIHLTLPNSSLLRDKSEVFLLINDHFRHLFDDCRWVVRKGVIVECCTFSFRKGKYIYIYTYTYIYIYNIYMYICHLSIYIYIYVTVEDLRRNVLSNKMCFHFHDYPTYI